jgi:predicted permease
VIVLSHAFWTHRFNAHPSIVGQFLQINGHPFTVIGVAPEPFRGTSILMGDVWIPAAMVSWISENGATQLAARHLPWLMVGGRLKPGVSLTQAAAELDALGSTLRRDYPRENGYTALRVSRLSALPSLLRLPIAGFLALLLGIVSLVLIIACANVAGILLARAAARRQEIAVRLALGAGRRRLARQLLTETMLLFLLGGVAGLVMAREMTSLLAGALPVLPVPVDLTFPLDGRVVTFTTGLSLIAAVLSGLVPALQASKADVVSVLKAHSQGPSDRLRLRHAFVIAQVAFSILLVVAAGLLTRAMQRTSSVELGFDPRGVEVADVDLSLAGYDRATGSVFASEVVDRLRRIPGVQDATVATGLPLEGVRRVQLVRRRGDAPPVVESTGLQPNWSIVGPGYFATLRIPMVEGREFRNADRNDSQRVTIVSEATARGLWPGQSALGKYLPAQPPFEAVASPADGLLVVGVVRDLKIGGTGRSAAVYVPFAQSYEARFSILARSTSGQRLTAEIRSLLSMVNPNLPIVTSRRLEDQSNPMLLQLRLSASVSGGVGLVGLLLASIGIYGVTAYTVTRRTREIGIRIAMGAQRKDVIGMILRQGMTLVAAGAALGLTLAALSSRVLARLLFGVPALDVISFGGALALFVAVGLAACYFPIRRATRIDAMDVLRYE